MSQLFLDLFRGSNSSAWFLVSSFEIDILHSISNVKPFSFLYLMFFLRFFFNPTTAFSAKSTPMRRRFERSALSAWLRRERKVNLTPDPLRLFERNMYIQPWIPIYIAPLNWNSRHCSTRVVPKRSLQLWTHSGDGLIFRRRQPKTFQCRKFCPCRWC